MIARCYGQALAAALLGTTALTIPVWAGCSTSGGITTCTGDVSDVFAEGNRLVVQDLTADITGGAQVQSDGSDADPSSNGDPGGDASDVSASFDGQGFGITSPSFDAVGLGARSYGGLAASGDHDTKFATNAHADPGGRGGDGGTASITFYSGTVNYANQSGSTWLVVAESAGGSGGAGGEAKVDTTGASYGGDGGVSGRGGAATVSIIAGKFSLVSDAPEDSFVLFALSQGGRTGGDGGEGRSEVGGNAHGGDGGVNDHAGMAAVSIVSATITMEGEGTAVAAHSIGQDGPAGGFGHASGGAAYGGAGGFGGNGGAASVYLGYPGSEGVEITTEGAGAIDVLSQGGDSGPGGNGNTEAGDAHGGAATLAGSAGSATLTIETPEVTIITLGAVAIHVASIGGNGGAGGEATSEDAGTEAFGGDGFFGGEAGAVTITSNGGGPIMVSTGTGGSHNHAVFAESRGGQGGNGGNATASFIGDAQGGNGGGGARSGTVTVDLWANVTTRTDQSQGVFARSYGGAGGSGGNADASIGSGNGGAGAGAAPGGNVSVSFIGSVATKGDEANALLAQSVGGFAGDGGNGSGIGGFGAGSQSAGNGGVVTVNAEGVTITTGGTAAYGVQALSVGGGGGRGGKGDGLISLGGSGSAGGSAGNVTVSLDADSSITTSGLQGVGLHAAGVGGGGGDGGGSAGILSLGGSGGKGGSGSRVTITNDGTIGTTGDYAMGIYALSLGGGGGSAHSTVGIEAIGGSGGGGGAGGPLTIANSSVITTAGDGSTAVFGQSIGGGGGNGSSATSGGIGFSQAIGGQGGSGNFANSVTYTDTGAAGRTIATKGDQSRGIFLQSVGGGGGNGGNSVSVSGGAPVNVALGFSGGGGSGGNSNWVQIINGKADIATEGDHSAAIHLQTVGGGGGNAGSDFSFTGPAVVDFAVGVGASGSGGGNAGTVWMQQAGALSTAGDYSPGLLAQTIGGGGGNGGNTVSGNLAGGLSFAPSIGGSAGAGGNSGNINISGGNGVVTLGENSPGISAQAIGGGGGHGGATVAASGISEVSVNVSVGGSGGSGGTGGQVKLDWAEEIATSGPNSAAVLAQSIGGGGGSSGTTVSGALSSRFSAQVAVGGSGGSGGTAGAVNVALTGGTKTGGDVSPGVLAQSVGGGGGHAGITLAGTAISNMSANVSVGGSGGGGGNAGTVTVIANGATTTGNASVGLGAMSVGGGGGSAHFTGAFSGESTDTANVSVGGKGGAAGDGAAVSVTSSGVVQTAGHNSTGIMAMSVGGGGGNGSWTVAGSLDGTIPINVAVGGDGGTAGSGAGVTVATSGGSITTAGTHSEGILAASIGNSGGNSGHTLSGAAVSGGDGGVSVGGKGGAGGKAGTVEVTNEATVTTGGAFANAIVAHSVAGGGGSAKGSIDGSALSMGDVAVTIGGSGGSGGDAGDVTVTNGKAATLTTAGYHAAGILAQSLGGSGGNGGFAAEASFTGGKVSGEAGVTIGGSGGSGGTAGTVTVVQGADIATSDFAAAGIVAQSVGGSGGNGGNVYTGNMSLSKDASATVNVDVGGTGGAGALSDTVSVTNNGNITTDGYLAEGILAQSIGGNGGRGGSAYAVLLTVNKGDSANIGVTVGGSGGAGQHSSTVSVDNTGTVTTKKGGSTGIVAMSVGGGGGSGGNAANLNIEPLPSSSGEDPSIGATVQVAVGGSGGVGGNGEAVTVASTGKVGTEGDASHGIHAMSIGGGGGTGGTASATSISFDGVCAALSGGAGYGCKADDESGVTDVSASLTVAIGGSGGAAGNAGNVIIENDGDIVTTGTLSHGIVAQSVGGGGGSGGSGGLGIEAWTTNSAANSINNLPGNFSFIPSFDDVSAAIGGTGGASGSGGKITVGGTGAIATEGDHSFGIHAQSIGGGGGKGGAGISDLFSQLTVGGRGGGGDGGAITVTTGAITTTGVRAHGIIAQSVGGSGGIAGISGVIGNADIQSFAGGAGDGGNSGAVTITTNGAINVSGQSAHGIFAQSSVGRLGSADVSGDVTININADITASGTSGRAILAQTEGGSGADTGTIAITIAEGATVSTAASGAETIGLFDGHKNTIVNDGTLRHAGTAADDYVIRTNGAKLSIINNGTIEGSILGEGTSSVGQAVRVTNAAGATFGLGGTIHLGPGGTFTSTGTISAGTVGTIGNSVIFGTLTQNAGGTMNVDFDFGGGNDLITALGGEQTSVAGAVLPNPVGTLPASGTRGSFVFLDARTGIVSNSLTVADTATVDYSLSQSAASGGGEEISLGYLVDYTPWNGTRQTQAKVTDTTREIITANHTSFGDYVDGLVQVRSNEIALGSDNYAFVDDLVFYLLNVEQVSDLVDVYDRYAPGEIFAPADAALFSSLRFADKLNSCPAVDAAGTAVFTEEGSCAWAEISGTARRRSRDGLSINYNENVYGISGGAQAEFADNKFAGFAIGYEHSDLSNGRVSGDGDRFQVGTVLKMEFGATTLSGSVSGGFSSFDLSRDVITPAGLVRAHGDPSTAWVTGHARLAHVFDVTDTVHLKPWFDLGVERVWQDGYTETGAGPYGLQVGGFDDTFLTLNPMLELGATFNAWGMATEANISAGALAILGATNRSTNVRLAGLGGNGPSFTVADETDQLFADIGVAIEAQVHQRATIEANFDTLLNSNQQEYVGSARINIFF